MSRVRIPAPILLITGPSGSGKTSSFALIAKQFGYSINEWVTPVDVELQRHNKHDAFRDDETNAYSETQSDQFSQFLFRASRYSSVFESSAKRVVLVEDFPNLFLKDVDAFNTVLELVLSFFKIIFYNFQWISFAGTSANMVNHRLCLLSLTQKARS